MMRQNLARGNRRSPWSTESVRHQLRPLFDPGRD